MEPTARRSEAKEHPPLGLANGSLATGLLLLVGLLCPLPALAQESLDGQPVNAIVFSGLDAMDAGDLEAVIATQARRCKNLIFTPLCWVTNSGTFEEKPRLDPSVLARDELRLRVHYWRAGYRFTEVLATVASEGDGVRVHFSVDEGAPTLVSAVDVIQADSVLSRRELLDARLPRAGDPLNLQVLDSAAVRIGASLRRKGYADAQVLDTTLLSDSANIARIRYEVRPGELMRMGQLSISGNDDVSNRTIRRLVDLPEGSVFRSDELMEAQRRLYRSELFRQALLQTGASRDGQIDVNLSVQEAPPTEVGLGVGLTTVDFGQAEARYTLYNWYGSARRVDLRTTVGNLLAPQLFGSTVFGSAAPFGIGTEVEDAFLRPTWQLSAQFSQPWLFSPKNSFSATLFASRRSVPGIVIDRGYGGGLTITRRLSPRTPISIGYQYERTRVEAGDLYFCVNFGVCQRTLVEALGGEQSLSPISLSVFADRSDDPLAPRRGWTGSLSAEHASTYTGSDFRYNRASLELAGFLPLGPGILAVRVRAGWVQGLDGTASAVGVPSATGDLVHPRKRFYAGGSRTVRGFGENQLGPRILSVAPGRLMESDSTTMTMGCSEAELADGTCDPGTVTIDAFQPRPLGGTSVIGGSLEYRLPLAAGITAALFIDAASVGDAGLDVPAGTRASITPGFGFRYQSPVGPIRLDLGIRPLIVEELPVVTQVPGEDGALRLVTLNQSRIYDPVEVEGSLFRRVLSRLQLHLSIGEAF